MDDRRLLDSGVPDDDDAVEKIAHEFREGFALLDADRPACRRRLRLGADPPRTIRPTRPRAPSGAELRRARLGGHHRRRARRDGGREPRREGGGRAVGRLQHPAPARAALERLPRHRPHLRALLRTQGLLREAVGGLRHRARRVRHARRAVRVADADPDRQGAALPGRAARLATSGRGCSAGFANELLGRWDDLGGRRGPPAPDRRSSRCRRGRASTATSAAVPRFCPRSTYDDPRAVPAAGPAAGTPRRRPRRLLLRARRSCGRRWTPSPSPTRARSAPRPPRCWPTSAPALSSRSAPAGSRRRSRGSNASRNSSPASRFRGARRSGAATGSRSR